MQYVVLDELHLNQVFEPFGELEFVDLHKDSVTGRSKGYAFVQYVYQFIVSFGIPHSFPLRYKRSEDARMALEQMDGFELAGRTVLSLSGCFFIILLTFVDPLL